MFAQQSLQPKLSRRRYAGVPYALQSDLINNKEMNNCSHSRAVLKFTQPSRCCFCYISCART